MRFLSAFVALVIFALLAVASVVFADTGLDVSEVQSQAGWSCARNNGIEFMITRGYYSFGAVDTGGLTNLQRAQAAGIPYHDVYHFPCMFKVSAQEQIQATYNYYKGYLTSGSMLWLDIETNGSPGCGYQSYASNCQFIGELISAARGLGIHLGIYASEYEWSITAGSGCTVGADNGLPLWYPNYDGQASYADFRPFGGWSHPSIKQYAGTSTYCGMSVDMNWYPN